MPIDQEIQVEQDFKLLDAVTAAGIQEGVPDRATLENIRVSPAFGGKPVMVFFCNAQIPGPNLRHETNLDYAVELIDLERLVEAAGHDPSTQLPCVWIEASGVELFLERASLTCDFSNAVFTKQDGERPRNRQERSRSRIAPTRREPEPKHELETVSAW